jgi:hypothetical protein
MSREIAKKNETKNGPVIELIPVKNPVSPFNDATIREVVLRSNQDVLNDYSEDLFPESLSALMLQKAAIGNESTHTFPICDRRRTDLSMYWNTMVQKYLLVFDHESQLVMHLNSRLFG